MSTRLLSRQNIKLYPTYKMFSWDLLFYYAIIYLFLTIEKNLSASSVLLVDAICQLSKLILQLPCVGLTDLLRSRKGLILANISCTLSVLILILSNNLITIIISNIIFAFSFNLRQLCESTILFETIPEHKSKHKIFSKIDGMSQARYYYLDSISALIAGFTFIINHYIPLILCLVCSCISTFIACRFEKRTKNIALKHVDKKHKDFSTYFKELKNVLKFIFSSKRLKCLLLYSGMFTGLLTFFINLRSIVLTQINIRPEFFGIALAIIQMISGISSKRANYIQSKLKNNVLTVFAFVNTLPIILIGLSLICHLPYWFNVTIISIWLLLYSLTKGPFYTLMKRYLQSFSPSEVITKVYGLDTIFASIFATIYAFYTSLLLKNISVQSTLIIVGSILSIAFLILLDHMKSFVGLKPDEYKKSEITYVKLK